LFNRVLLYAHYSFIALQVSSFMLELMTSWCHGCQYILKSWHLYIYVIDEQFIYFSTSSVVVVTIVLVHALNIWTVIWLL
jgi:hypothetical protein